ncbi:MAG: hypothetical protein K2J82_05295 [Muribaculaceae bacterium]|nr:hypothetical protein [Muribaculaceae bacterium]
MKKTFNIRHSLIFPALLVLLGIAASCNSESKKTDDEVAVTSSTVAVNSFHLKADSKVLKGLDSIFFSVDLNNAVIFNADSLPKGTNISKIVPVITFASSMSKADLIELSETGDTIKKINYLQTTTDSINFNHPVRLKVSSFDKTNTLEYSLKVNVHKMNPDSIGWDNLQAASLPSRLDNPLRRKNVLFNNVPFSLIEESDNTFSLAEASDIYKNEWNVNPVSLPFSPVVESFTASSSAFYILSADGALYSSPDASAWSAIAAGWEGITGIYGSDTVVGLKRNDDGDLCHVYFADGTETVANPIPGNFPVKANSPMVTISNQWAELPTAFFNGGICQNGNLSSATWAFDGNSWSVLSEKTPALESPALVKYVMYRNATSATKIKDFDAWLIIGGTLADGELNRNIYLSFDNGVTWLKAPEAMNLPESFPTLTAMNAFVVNRRLDADLAQGWSEILTSRTRASYEIDGTEIFWDCPYIYLAGGYFSDGSLSHNIWRGVLMRLNFTPLI